MAADRAWVKGDAAQNSKQAGVRLHSNSLRIVAADVRGVLLRFGGCLLLADES